MPSRSPDWSKDQRIAAAFQACTAELSRQLNAYARVLVATSRDIKEGRYDVAEARLRGAVIAARAARGAKQ